MDTSLIRVATEVLAAKESQMRRLSTDIYGAIQYNFNAAPVDTAYDKLHDKWIEHRVELTTTIDRIANILRDIRAAWEAAEDAIVAKLNESGSGGDSAISTGSGQGGGPSLGAGDLQPAAPGDRLFAASPTVEPYTSEGLIVRPTGGGNQ